MRSSFPFSRPTVFPSSSSLLYRADLSLSLSIDADGGLLSTVGKRGQDAPNYAEADAKADEQVAQVTDESNDGKSAVAQ